VTKTKIEVREEVGERGRNEVAKFQSIKVVESIRGFLKSLKN
jgi:hypothetical protein